MRFFVLLALFGVAYAFPAEPRDAEVIPITDKDAPIILNSENEVLPRNTNATSSDTPISPSPVPESQAITTEKLPESNTPNLVPTVVDISTTPNPAVTQPPFPTNATSTPTPDEEDEESDEDESEEEADEEDDDDEEADDEDEEEEDAEEEEDDVAAKTLKKNRVTRQAVDEEIGGSVKLPAKKPTLGSVVIVSENVDEERSDEDDGAAVVESAPIETLKVKPNLVNGSRLQSIPARSPTNEDDELENKQE